MFSVNINFILKIDTISFTKTISKTALHPALKDHNMNLHHHENLTSPNLKYSLLGHSNIVMFL